jgi:hypothetical protein
MPFRLVGLAEFRMGSLPFMRRGGMFNNAHKMVLFGPPGTGKSQTIANMIVQLLAVGKTVLFVSQKTTALEVVRRRLDRIGVGDYCLEVHSAKAQKTEVLAQLKTAWEKRAESAESDWTKSTDNLAALRDEPTALVSALHRRRANGMTARQAMGRVIVLRDLAPGLRLNFGDALTHEEEALERLRACLKDLAIALKAVGSVHDHPLAGVSRKEWSPAWKADFIAAADAFAGSAEAYIQTRDAAAAATGFAPPPSLEATPVWLSLAILALKPFANDAVCWLAEDSRPFRAEFAAWRERRAACDEIAKRMTGPYREDVFALPLAAILQDHQQASNAVFFLRGGKVKAVAARLAPFAASEAPVDIARDAPALLDLEVARQAARSHDARMERLGPIWKGLDTDPEAVEARFAWEDSVRAGADQLAGHGGDPAAIIAALRKLVEERPDTLANQGPVAHALKRLVAAYQDVEAARVHLVEVAEPEAGFGLAQDAG